MNDSAREIMLEYFSRTVSRTDLDSTRGMGRRYLWTDAFAVCNFVGLFEQQHEPEHRRSSSWTGHRDINEVMLATSLAPHGYLGVPRPSVSA